MVSTYTDNLRLTKQGDNDNPNTWGQIINEQVIDLLDEAISGVISVDCTGSSDIDLSASTANGATDAARHAVLELIGTVGANIQLIVPSVEKIYIVRAAHTGGYTINMRPIGGGSGIDFTANKTAIVYVNGTNIYEVIQAGSLFAANNLSDLTNTATARANLDLEVGVDVQAFNTSLTSLASNTVEGIIVQTDDDTVTARTLTAGSAAITVTNGSGVSGNPTIDVVTATTDAAGIVELATNAEAQAGVVTNRAVTPANLGAMFGFSKYYESSNQTISLGSNVTVTHGLGAIPKFATAELVCVSNDRGFTTGDRIPFLTVMGSSAGVSRQIVISYNATNITISYDASAMILTNKSGAAATAIDPGSWKVVVRAWA